MVVACASSALVLTSSRPAQGPAARFSSALVEQAGVGQAAADHAGDVAGDGALGDQALLAAVLGDERDAGPDRGARVGAAGRRARPAGRCRRRTCRRRRRPARSRCGRRRPGRPGRRSRRPARRRRCRGRYRGWRDRRPRAPRRRPRRRSWGTGRRPRGRPSATTISSTEVSATASVETYSPSRITVTVSQSANTSSKRWEMKTRARPSSRRLRATANSRSTSTPLRAAVGSSITRRLASSEIAFAISMICWSAMERPRAGRRGSMATPSRANSAVASAYIAARSIRRAGAQRLAAHEDVLGDREVGEERRLLVDHRDPGGLRLGRRTEVDVLAVEPEGRRRRAGGHRRRS